MIKRTVLHANTQQRVSDDVNRRNESINNP